MARARASDAAPSKRKSSTAKANQGSYKKKKKIVGDDSKEEEGKTLAEKKRHVRDLAREGNWDKIRALYGEKMVARAKESELEAISTTVMKKCPATDAAPPEKPMVTPEMIAKQILEKNGYGVGSATSKPVAHKRKDTIAHVGPRLPVHQRHTVPEICASPPRREHPKPTPKPEPRRDVVKDARVAVIADSPDTLTEEQKRRIEERRREALEKRRRLMMSAPTTTPPAPSAFTTLQYQPKARHDIPRAEEQRSPLRLQVSKATTMLQELEIAAQISDWDLEEPVARVQDRQQRPRLVTPPLPRGRGTESIRRAQAEPVNNQASNTRAMRELHQSTPDKSVARLLPQNTVTPPAQAPSLSQELRAAVEIAMWELDQEQREARGPTAVKRKHQAANDHMSSPDPQPQFAEAHSHAHEDDQTFDLDSFMKKHFIADQMDPVVIDFVNMMLA